MRIGLPALLGLAFLTQSASAQSSAWADKLFGGVSAHDFGVQPRGTQLKYKFKMTNIYKVPLEITDIRVTCGCLTAHPSTKIIQPNETAWLHINMDAGRFVGHKTIRLFLTVGPEFISTATLTVSANARTDVVFNPGEIDFGLVSRGQTPTKHIDVEYAGAFDWRVTEIMKNSSAPFELKVQDLPGGARGHGYRIFATLKPDAPAEQFKQEIMLKTNDPSAPVLTFHIVGNVQASLKAQPETASLTGVALGATETKRVVVRGTRPFRITAVEGQGEGITVHVSPKADTTQFVEIRFQPTKAGEIHRELNFITDLDGANVKVVVEASSP